jgi:hypothetical protein
MKTMKKIAAMTFLAILFAISSGVPSFAGALGGSRHGSYTLYANRYNNFSVAFRGGEVARVRVSGDGSTNLDLYIYDEYGRLIASDSDYSDECVVGWIPCCTATYTIQVVNRGLLWNDYELWTN